MKWCSVMNMWCSDMDYEDVDSIGCDGECFACEVCEEVAGKLCRVQIPAHI